MSRKGITTLEYAVLIAVIVAAYIGMAVYMKRSLCGGWRKAADTFGQGRQYQLGITEVF